MKWKYRRKLWNVAHLLPKIKKKKIGQGEIGTDYLKQNQGDTWIPRIGDKVCVRDL